MHCRLQAPHFSRSPRSLLVRVLCRCAVVQASGAARELYRPNHRGRDQQQRRVRSPFWSFKLARAVRHLYAPDTLLGAHANAGLVIPKRADSITHAPARRV
eukprot:6211412-Pleurochrysis_carterae.AAC.1